MKLPKLRKKQNSTFKTIAERLEKRRDELLEEFSEKNQDVQEWLEKRGLKTDEVVAKGARGVLAASAASVVLLSGGVANDSVQDNTPVVRELQGNKLVEEVVSKQVVDEKLVSSLSPKIEGKKTLSEAEQAEITETISQITDVKVRYQLDGNRLNTNIGLIGLEQHLPRYAGESLSEHFSSAAGSLVYGKSGMTKGKGAFGYFGSDRLHLSAENVDQEKYYVVVQTFLSSGWGKKPGIVDWYKHRKVLVVNPENGRAVVGDIADSGPAPSTGKSFGGSPELMDQLGLYRNVTKGKVLIYFIDSTVSNPKLGPL